MRWNKLGKVYDVEATSWIASHAQVPTAIALDDRIRVFIAGRNSAGKSFPTYVDVARDNPTQILAVADKPCLGFGAPGTFDDDGVMPSEILQKDGLLYLYYSGWNQKVSTPYHNCMGLAVSHDLGISFKRVFEGPIMDRTPLEPYLAVTPTIIREDSTWKMWYVSGLRWKSVNDKYEPVYVIKYATSCDGVNWIRPNFVAIPQRNQDEAFSRPCVVKRSDGYHMWYCFRDSTDYRDGKGAYRMGYSSSTDGIHWERKDDDVGITVSDDDWDSTMICYPYILEVDDKLLMFYNGNSFGRHGFGCAILEEK